MCVEECSELIKALCKLRRLKEGQPLRNNADYKTLRANLIEEVADVIVVLEEIKIIHSIRDDEIDEIIDYKLDRTFKNDKRLHTALTESPEVVNFLRKVFGSEESSSDESEQK